MRMRSIVGCAATALIGAAALAAPDGAAPAVNPAEFVITSFGAVSDGTTLNTASIQKAIDAAAATGGTVVVPAGTFLSGSIFLKPGVNLRVDKGGVLKGSTNTADYPTMRTRIEGHFQDWLPALVNAYNIDHLRISGEGTLDGSGTPFYAAFRSRIAADRTTKNLDVPRPRMVFIWNCSDAHVSDLHFLNSGFWNLHIYHSHNVEVSGLDINAAAGSPSTDGIDVDSSQYVNIHGCRIANNDDGVALKGSKGPLAVEDKDSPPDEHIHIYDCTFDRGGSFVTCGSEATTVRDVELDHCKAVGNANRGISVLRLKLRTDTPQIYDDIHVHDITLEGAGTIINVAGWQQYDDLQGHQRPHRIVRNISISNVTGSFGSFGSVAPPAGDIVENVTLENIDVTLPAGNGATPKLSGIINLMIKNVKINGTEYKGPATQPTP